MALALSLPHDFAMRENIVVLTFGVVLFTLLIPGLTIEPLVRILGMASDDKRLREYFTLKSRLYAESNALKDLEHQFTSGIVTRGIYLRIRDEILSKQRELSHRMEEMKLEHSIIESIQEGETRKRLLESRKDSLLRLLREEAGDPDIVEELVMEVDKDLDQIVSDERKIEEQLRRDSKKPSSGFLTLKMKKHEKDESDQSDESKETQEVEIETKQEKH